MDEIGERVRDLARGCCVLRVEPEDENDEDFNEHMALPLWKSFQSLNLMLPKEDRSAMLLRIYNDTTPLINMGIQKGDKAKEEEAKKEDAEMKDAEEVVATTDVEVLDAPAPEVAPVEEVAAAAATEEQQA
jgi:multisite-specific tRNA:(cytosine-C5)-methyltransferase